MMISTHNELLASLFQRKLRSVKPEERTRVVSLTTWSREGRRSYSAKQRTNQQNWCSTDLSACGHGAGRFQRRVPEAGGGRLSGVREPRRHLRRETAQGLGRFAESRVVYAAPHPRSVHRRRPSSAHRPKCHRPTCTGASTNSAAVATSAGRTPGPGGPHRRRHGGQTTAPPRSDHGRSPASRPVRRNHKDTAAFTTRKGLDKQRLPPQLPTARQKQSTTNAIQP